MMMLLALSLQILSPEPDVTALPEIVVVARPMDYRLQVDLTGAEAESDLVVSQDPGMFCGDERFQRTPGPYRQCWLRGVRGEPIVLSAQHAGVFGRDWTVDWTGCTPQGDGRACQADIRGEMAVQAAFRRL